MNEKELINNLSELAIETQEEVFFVMLDNVNNKTQDGIDLIKSIEESTIDTKEKLFKFVANIIAEEIYKEKQRIRFLARNN